MRQDQYEKLQQLEEKLLDTFLAEADPATWPGQGVTLANMDAKTRGDLYWCRKTAASVLMLATRVASTIGSVQLTGAGTTPAAPMEGGDESTQPSEAEQLDGEIARAEREAARLMQQLQSGSGKAAFDRKVHGRG